MLFFHKNPVLLLLQQSTNQENHVAAKHGAATVIPGGGVGAAVAVVEPSPKKGKKQSVEVAIVVMSPKYPIPWITVLFGTDIAYMFSYSGPGQQRRPAGTSVALGPDVGLARGKEQRSMPGRVHSGPSINVLTPILLVLLVLLVLLILLILIVLRMCSIPSKVHSYGKFPLMKPGECDSVHVGYSIVMEQICY